MALLPPPPLLLAPLDEEDCLLFLAEVDDSSNVMDLRFLGASGPWGFRASWKSYKQICVGYVEK